MPAPRIRTAIPQRRYQLGEFGVTVLGEIESADDVAYRFIAAFVREGEQQPQAWVTVEDCPPGERAEGRFRLRMVTGSMDDVLSTDDCWSDLDATSTQALELARQFFGMADEDAYRLA